MRISVNNQERKMVMGAGGNHVVPDVDRPVYRHIWPHTSL